MPGYDDPRFLQNVIEKLQKDVKELRAATLPLAVHQRGAIPGAMRAVSIGDQGLKSNMWLNLNGQQPGLAPYQAITDAAGTVRAELGNLAANGISPAQFGFRANNAAGTPIFDSLGLINVMQVLGSVFVSTAFPTNSTTPVLITGATTTFTPARQSRVLVLYGGSVSYSGQTAIIDLFVDGANQSTGGNGPALQLQFPTTASGAVTSTGFFTTTLTAASHTIDLRAWQTGTTTLSVLQCAINVYNLGVV